MKSSTFVDVFYVKLIVDTNEKKYKYIIYNTNTILYIFHHISS